MAVGVINRSIWLKVSQPKRDFKMGMQSLFLCAGLLGAIGTIVIFIKGKQTFKKFIRLPDWIIAVIIGAISWAVAGALWGIIYGRLNGTIPPLMVIQSMLVGGGNGAIFGIIVGTFYELSKLIKFGPE